MTTNEKLAVDLKEAMINRDELVVSVLRLAKSAIHNQEIAKQKKDKGLNEEETVQVLMSEAKKRRDSIEAYTAGHRDDLASQEAKELKIIEKYLPSQLSEVEIKKIVEEVVAKSGDEKNFGKIMGAVMARAAGRADGTVVSKAVKAALQ
jgi:hypothetical protein